MSDGEHQRNGGDSSASARWKEQAAAARRRTRVGLAGGGVVLLVTALFVSGVPQEFWYLRKLRSDDLEERELAARKLSSGGVERAIPELASLLADDSSTPILDLNYAGDALVTFGDRSVPALLDVLGGEDEEARSLVPLAFERLGGAARGAVPDLVRRLESDDEALRDATVRTLAHIGTEEAAAKVLPILLEDLRRKDTPRYGATISSLGRHAVGSLTRVLREELTNKPYEEGSRSIAHIWSSRRPLAMRAANMLALIGDDAKEALPLLEELESDCRLDTEIPQVARQVAAWIDAIR